MEINFSCESKRFLKNATTDLSQRILKKIDLLKTNCFPKDCKRINNSFYGDKVFRIRVGEFRVLYEIVGSEVILIHKISKRSQVYIKEDKEKYL
jgi:mRNA-degrading endonuclease RelE of RelBE toxin-antitoxin system